VFFFKIKTTQLKIGRVVLNGTTLLCSANASKRFFLLMEKFKILSFFKPFRIGYFILFLSN